jgi:hypothetical protein
VIGTFFLPCFVLEVPNLTQSNDSLCFSGRTMWRDHWDSWHSLEVGKSQNRCAQMTFLVVSAVFSSQAIVINELENTIAVFSLSTQSSTLLGRRASMIGFHRQLISRFRGITTPSRAIIVHREPACRCNVTLDGDCGQYCVLQL